MANALSRYTTVRNKAMRDGILVEFEGLCEIAKEEKLLISGYC